MASKLKKVCLVFAAIVALAVISAFLVYDRVYYAELRAMQAAAASEGFRVGATWMHEEDLALEDFGLRLEKGDLRLWVDIRYSSDVRGPDTKIRGIALQSLQEGWEANERIFYFDSAFWLDHGLPKIGSPKEFFAHASAIWPLLLQSKVQIAGKPSQYHTEEFRDLLILRDDPETLSPVYDNRGTK